MEKDLRYITKIGRVAEMYDTFALKEINFSNTEITALHTIRHNKGITAAELWQKLAVDKAAVSRMLEKFENGGYIIREVDESDKRIKRIYATDKLGELKKGFVNCEERFYSYLIDGADETKLDAFYEILNYLYIKSKAERKNKFAGIIEYEK